MSRMTPTAPPTATANTIEVLGDEELFVGGEGLGDEFGDADGVTLGASSTLRVDDVSEVRNQYKQVRTCRSHNQN
jgi:hypothetical protein